MLSHLLHLAGVDCIVIENRSRAYCEARVRAGLMEHWVAQLLIDTGVGERLQREAMVHDGIYVVQRRSSAHRLQQADRQAGLHLRPEGGRDRPDRQAARRRRTILFEVEDTSVHDFDSAQPKIRFRHGGMAQEIECDFIGGCDGFHGICRPSIPAAAWRGYDRVYPFGWLGVLTESPPPEDELIYCFHDRGFALFSMRGPQVSRLYLQVPPRGGCRSLDGYANLGRT
jgi:p-hydroxybenzoate 3-monooxygenase